MDISPTLILTLTIILGLCGALAAAAWVLDEMYHTPNDERNPDGDENDDRN